MSETIECLVAGAGAVGLAVARALARAGREVVVCEADAAIGTGISSRNSEVIHAGLYYAPGSLKARLCVRGRELLYPFLEAHGVTVVRCGKLVVARDEGEITVLRRIAATARANGVLDVRWLDAEEARTLEPNLACEAALLSPSTGIFDSHGYLLALRGTAEAAGAIIALNAPVVGGRIEDDGAITVAIGGAEPLRVSARVLVNCAGLGAPALAGAMQGLPTETVPRLYYCKGNYFSLKGPPPFTHLVYPVPDLASVGLHYTRDLAGRGRFGPDVEWVDRVDYDVDPRRAERFYAAIRRYWPNLRDGALQPDYAGVRPKLQAPGEPPRDFRIDGPATHGIPGLVNLFGIESPGLTASLAIAEHVMELLDGVTA